MPIANQTNLSITWGQDGAKTDPDPSDVLRPNYKQGWQSEIPTLQEFNFVLNALDNNIMYMAEHGRYAWEAGVDYGEGASVHSGARMFYSKTNTPGSAPLSDNYAKWVMGFVFGDMGMSAYSNTQGLLLSNIGGFTSTTLWEGNDLTVKASLPLIEFQSTGAGDNWLLGNIENEMCVHNLGAISLPNNKNVAKSSATTYRLYHEGHTPTQAEVSGTIPDAPNNANGYVRQGGNWTVAANGLADAPADGADYLRRDNAWEKAVPLADRGTVIQSIDSKANMLAKGFLRMDGRPVSRTTYAALYTMSLVEGGWGDGNGSTTFNTPKIPPLKFGDAEWDDGEGDNFFIGQIVAAMAVNTANSDAWVTTRTSGGQGCKVWKNAGGNSTWVEFADFPTEESSCMTVNSVNGHVYLAMNLGSKIYRSSNGTGAFILEHSMAANSGNISSMATTGGGSVYYSQTSGLIGVFRISGPTTRLGGITGAGNGMYGMHVKPDDGFLYAVSNTGIIRRSTDFGVTFTNFYTHPGTASNFRSLTYDSNDQIWYTVDYLEDDIWKLEVTETASNQWRKVNMESYPEATNAPIFTDVAFDVYNNKVWVSNWQGMVASLEVPVYGPKIHHYVRF